MAVSHAGRLGSNADILSATTIVVTLSAGLAVDAVVTVLTGTNSANAVSGVADSRGNTYVVHAGGGSNIPGLASALVETALQSGDTVTVTYAATSTRRAAAVDGWTGLSDPGWFEATAADASADNDATVDTPTVAPAGAALLLGAAFASGSLAGRAFTAGTDYTALPETTIDNGVTYVFLWSEWRRVATGGTYDATGAITGGAAVHADRVAAFAEAPSAAGRSSQAIFIGI